MSGKYRTKSIPVEALQLTDNHDEFAAFCGVDSEFWARRVPGDGIHLEGVADDGDDLSLPNGTWAVALEDGITFLSPAQFARVIEPSDA